MLEAINLEIGISDRFKLKLFDFFNMVNPAQFNSFQNSEKLFKVTNAICVW